MKKTVILMRHAKSSWKDPTLDDVKRPLNARGKRDAPFMGKQLRNMSIKLDLIIASPAKRALKTARAIAKEIEYPKKRIRIEEKIYSGESRDFLDIIHELDDSVKRVCLIGHNPVLTTLANILCDQSVDNIPTCGLFAFTFDVSCWKDVTQGKGTFLFFEYPKKYHQSSSK